MSRPKTGAASRVGGTLRAAAPAGRPGLVGGASYTVGDRGGDVLVEDAGNDVLTGELSTRETGGQSVRRRDLHLVVPRPRPGAEQPAEEAREALRMPRAPASRVGS